ncbi:MAG: 50S ribosomal protein L22 [Actinomycetota bacterium]
MPGLKTNEREGTKAVLRNFHMSASKARQVLNLVRGEEVGFASEILASTQREAADVIGKVLASAVANAQHNDGIPAEELFISACYADEGTTMKRWRPRARGRASRIRKRSCHITVIVSRMDDERLERRRAAIAASGAGRSRRVSESRRRADLQGRATKRQTQKAEDAAAAAAAEEAEEAEAAAAINAGEEVAPEQASTDDSVTTEATVETEANAQGSDEAAEASSDAPDEDATNEEKGN